MDQLNEHGELEPGEDRFLEVLENAIDDSDGIQSLIDEIAEQLEAKFDAVQSGKYERDKSGWPLRWVLHTSNREKFILDLSRFTSNNAKHFGQLLTPLVSGIRVAGPFRPTWLKGRNIPKLVFIDGEGLGHTPDSATALPTGVTKRYEMAEIILLVDSAQQPMQAAPQAVLRSLAASGNISKLALLFTHFDQVVGDDLQNRAARKNHILASVDGVIAAIEKDLGISIGSQLRQQIGERTFFVSRIQNSIGEKAQYTRQELVRLIEIVQAASAIAEPIEATPTYDLGKLVLSLRTATESFHSKWNARLWCFAEGLRPSVSSTTSTGASRLPSASRTWSPSPKTNAVPDTLSV